MKKPSLKIISLFSGAGGLDLGFIQAGHKVLWAIDNDKDSCETYKKNIGDHIVCEDINNTNINHIPKADLVLGGFPCVGFSIANQKRSLSDERNHLYKGFVKVVKTKLPKYFIAENVRGILNLEKGLIFNKIIKEFESLGYNVDYRVINAADYAVPQNRIRVFILGVKKNKKTEFAWLEPEITDIKKRITIEQALQGIPEPNGNNILLNHIGSKYKITNRNFTGHRKTDPNKPSPTILARGNGKGGVCAIQHFKNHRRMTVREQAIIQTFPLDFEFFGSISSMYRQVGNAVPVKLAYKIAKCFK
jgi:DNA (cytosine-5)-methyltransferase 1